MKKMSTFRTPFFQIFLENSLFFSPKSRKKVRVGGFHRLRSGYGKHNPFFLALSSHRHAHMQAYAEINHMHHPPSCHTHIKTQFTNTYNFSYIYAQHLLKTKGNIENRNKHSRQICENVGPSFRPNVCDQQGWGCRAPIYSRSPADLALILSMSTNKTNKSLLLGDRINNTFTSTQ